MNYKQIVDRALKNEVIIGVDPAIARRFYTDTTNRWLEKNLSETMTLERFLVKGAFLVEPLVLIVAIGMAIPAFKWFSLLVIPIVAVAWIFYGGICSMGRQTILGVLIFSSILWLSAYYFRERLGYLSFFLWCSLFLMSWQGLNTIWHAHFFGSRHCETKNYSPCFMAKELTCRAAKWNLTKHSSGLPTAAAELRR